MSKINEINEKLIVILQDKIKLLEDQKEISKKISKIQEEQLIIADVSGMFSSKKIEQAYRDGVRDALLNGYGYFDEENYH